MNKVIKYIFFLGLILSACSPKLRYAISNPQPPLSPADPIVILQEIDTTKIQGKLVGTLFSGDNGFSVNCSYYEIMNSFKSEARKNGANIIKIIKHKYPDKLSTCDRITAELYRADEPFTYEKEIDWNEDRKLNWNDFKGKPRMISNNNVGAQTYAQLAYQSNYVTFFTKAKIFTRATFDCNLSWVRPDQKTNNQILQHEQGHFDICELYRRKLQKEFDANKITSNNISVLGNEIFKNISKAYNDRQELYEEETSYGLNTEKQQQWQNDIAKELSALNDYIQQ